MGTVDGQMVRNLTLIQNYLINRPSSANEGRGIHSAPREGAPPITEKAININLTSHQISYFNQPAERTRGLNRRYMLNPDKKITYPAETVLPLEATVIGKNFALRQVARNRGINAPVNQPTCERKRMNTIIDKIAGWHEVYKWLLLVGISYFVIFGIISALS